MTVEVAASIAEVIASVGVLVSLFFVGYQYRQHSHLIERGEQNATMAEWSRIRMALVENPEVAELWHSAQTGSRELTEIESLRMDSFLAEQVWAAYHVWDRTARGLFDHGRFEDAAGPIVASVLRADYARSWWVKSRMVYPSRFVADVDAVIGPVDSTDLLGVGDG